MNRYDQSMYRPTFGIAAVAMTAITIGLAVIVPAGMDSGGRNGATLSAATAVRPVLTEVAISPARIDIVAVREQKTAYEAARYVLPKRKQAG